MQKSDRIKAEVSLRQVAEDAGVKWDLRKSRQSRGDWWGPCPFHAETTASFHVVEPGGTGGFFKCFGCGVGGTVIDFTAEHLGLDFVAAVRHLASQAGLENEISQERKAALEKKRAQNKAQAEALAERQAANGHRVALDLWSRADRNPPLVAEYLAARGVRLPAIGGVPATLRLAHLDHYAGGYDRNSAPDHKGPAMVAAIGRDKLAGAHRTWITATGRARYCDGKKVAKQWIGRTGDMMGRPCVLSSPTSAVVVGEGIETTLAAYSALVAGGRIGWSAEAALSRGAITGPAQEETQLWTPRPGVSEVLILGEGSSKNPAEARALYHGARDRLEALGLSVRLAVPNERWDQDADFADLAVAELVKD
jgi:hypothetical protein